MKIRIKFIAIFTVFLPFNLFADSWSQPKKLAGTALPYQSFSDLNGILNLTSNGDSSSSVAPERPMRQILKTDGNISNPVAYPLFPNNGSTFSQKGNPISVVQDLNGNRILNYYTNNGLGVAMIFQFADGTFGPNIVSGADSRAIAFRDGLVIQFNVGNNGVVAAREWTVAADGTISNSVNKELIDIDQGGCGAVVGIDADHSATAIFRLANEVKSAHRTPAGVWSIDAHIIDSTEGLIAQGFGCVTGRSSPGGRIVAAWWLEGQDDVDFGIHKDLGGAARAIVREPSGPIPATFVTLVSAPASDGDSRRYVGVTAAMGLDGTAAVLAQTEYCAGKTLLTSTGILRIAGPADNFELSGNLIVPFMDSGAGEIFADSANHTPAWAFAAENKRAIIGFRRIAYPEIGTDKKPACGAGQPINDPTTTTAKAIYYDASSGFSSDTVGLGVTQPGHQETGDYAELIDAAIDFAGNAALVRAAPFHGTSDLIVKGSWQGSTIPVAATPTPVTGSTGATPTAVSGPVVSFSDNVKNQVNEALKLLAVAKKALPTAKTAKAKTQKALITQARKDLNVIVAALNALLNSDSANISANFKNYTAKNIKDLKAGIKNGSSNKLSKKEQSAGWSKAKSLLSKLIA